jgi:hypothetical protein
MPFRSALDGTNHDSQLVWSGFGALYSSLFVLFELIEFAQLPVGVETRRRQ